MPSITLRFLLTVALFALLTFPAREGQTAEGDAAKLDQLSSEQSWDASIKLARSITTDPDQDEDLTFALARLAEHAAVHQEVELLRDTQAAYLLTRYSLVPLLARAALRPPAPHRR